MLRLVALLSVTVVALVGAAGDSAGASSEEIAIRSALIAPYGAVLSRDAPSLCSDFTPAAAAKLVQGAPGDESCESAAGALFAEATPGELPLFSPPNAARFKFEQVRSGRATVELGLGPNRGLEVNLQLVGARWLISSGGLLAAGVCAGTPLAEHRCQAGSKVIVFALEGAVLPLRPFVPVPAAVRRAGGSELHEFVLGRKVAAETGCLACHRIGTEGNKGPGPNLTRVGRRLDRPAIVHALVDPRAPMPSFKNLPARRFKALVRFLALLR